MSVEKSLKQIIYEVSEIEKAHKQTRSFHFGDLLDIIKKGKVDYASIFMSVNNATTDENFTTLTVELYAFDILAQDDANRVDVENTTQQILDDFITIIRYSTRWNNFCEVDSSVPERKFYDTLQDRLSGWSATIQVKVYRNDCLVGLPIDDYDFDQHGNFEAVVMAFVQNSEGTILASKLVSDSDDVIPVPNITITDTDGTEIDYPSGKNFACTPPTCEDADIFINGVEVSNVPSGGTVDLQVVNEDDEQVGAWDGTEWVVPNGGATIIRGNFQANRGVLDTFVIDAESEGIYISTTNDGASGTITILVNGSPIAFPQTLAIGDLLDVSRTTTTSIGWYQLNG
jgi:hypothetical protein